MKISRFVFFIVLILGCYFAIRRLSTRRPHNVAPDHVTRDNLHDEKAYKKEVLHSTIKNDLERATEERAGQGEEVPQTE